MRRPRADAEPGDSPERRGRALAGEVLTIREVAAYLKLPLSTVYRLAERRELPGHKVGRQWRFHKPVLDEWFRRRATAARATILVVDDEEATREVLAAGLQAPGRQVLTAASGEEALEIVRRSAVDLVLLDLVMPGLDGAETFRRLRALRPEVAVVIVTGYPDSELMARALESGPFTVINKPVDLPQVQKVVERILGG